VLEELLDVAAPAATFTCASADARGGASSTRVSYPRGQGAFLSLTRSGCTPCGSSDVSGVAAPTAPFTRASADAGAAVSVKRHSIRSHTER
jgi:hypothetical protein